MARVFTAYTVVQGSAVAHAQATSTGTGDVKTITRPAKATACFITVTTTMGYFTFDGTTPASTNGMPIQAALAPIFIPVGVDIKVASSAGANCVVNVFWLE